MDLINEEVRHKSFGMGQVVGQVDSYVEVRFKEENKKFVFPDAFGEFLTIVDKDIQKKLEGLISKVELKRQIEEERLAEERALEQAKLERIQKREQLMKNHKLHSASQVAFWLDEAEQEQVFTKWEVFTGEIKSGADQGKPNRLPRLHQNSCCIITSREPQQAEKERRIVGLFMVAEGFIGRLCEDGLFPAHAKYKMRLSQEESEKILFWKYYINERYPSNMTWNSGRHRYFDNIWLAQILQDLHDLKQDEGEKEFLAEFLEYFCHLNQIEGEIPKPNGALVREQQKG